LTDAISSYLEPKQKVVMFATWFLEVIVRAIIA